MKSLAKYVLEVEITLYENERLGVSFQALANDMIQTNLPIEKSWKARTNYTIQYVLDISDMEKKK